MSQAHIEAGGAAAAFTRDQHRADNYTGTAQAHGDMGFCDANGAEGECVGSNNDQQCLGVLDDLDADSTKRLRESTRVIETVGGIDDAYGNRGGDNRQPLDNVPGRSPLAEDLPGAIGRKAPGHRPLDDGFLVAALVHRPRERARVTTRETDRAIAPKHPDFGAIRGNDHGAVSAPPQA